MVLVSEGGFIEKDVDTSRHHIENPASFLLNKLSHLRMLSIVFVINSCITQLVRAPRHQLDFTDLHLRCFFEMLCLTGMLCFCLWIVILDLRTKISCFNSYFNCSVCGVILFLR